MPRKKLRFLANSTNLRILNKLDKDLNFNSINVIIQYSILESSVTMNFLYQSIYLILTIGLSCGSGLSVLSFGTILGVVLAFGQRSKFKAAFWLANLCWIFRGTPMMVQIMVPLLLAISMLRLFRLGFGC